MTRDSRPHEPGTRGPSFGLQLAFGIVVAGLGAISCLPVWSVQHLGTPADTLFDERLRGHWVSGNFLPDSFVVTRAEFDPVRGSRLTRRTHLPSGPWRYEEWDFRLVHLGGRWFADLPPQAYEGAPSPPLRASQLEKLGRAAQREAGAMYEWVMKEHFRRILRVDVEADTLTFSHLDDTAVQQFAGSYPRPVGLANFPKPDGYTLILTDSTSRLREFIRDVAPVDSLFHDEQRLVRAH